jgi:hypothetical protein
MNSVSNFRRLISGFVLALLLSAAAWPQAAPPPQQSKPPDMNHYWDKLLQDVVPTAPADPALLAPQEPVRHRQAGDFLNHFYLESRTEYTRQEVSFTGQPMPSGVIDGTFGDFINPTGIPFRDAFQPNSNQVFQFLNGGTREWLSPRLNTNFSVRYRQDLTHVTNASPELTLVNSLYGNRQFDLLNGSIEIRGLPGDGKFAGTSLQLGRQYTYGAELAAFDGASFHVNRRRYTATVFGGRRFTFYSQPVQRAIGGVNLAFRLTDTATVEYQGIAYVKGSHTVSFTKRFTPGAIFNTYLRMVGGSAVDYNAQMLYNMRGGRTSVRGSFFEKLSDKDFTYDYTTLATDRDPYNQLARLYLGPLHPYTQTVLDVRHEVTPRIRVGGSLWLRYLNDPANQGPYDTTFQDYHLTGQLFAPWRFEPYVEVRQRNTERRSPLGVTDFDDVSIAGETRMQEAQFELRRVLGEGRLALRGGAFYRRFNFQDRFFYINNASVRGFIGGAQVKLDDRTRLSVDYSLDNDFVVLRPSIQHAQVFRVGMDWRY